MIAANRNVDEKDNTIGTSRVRKKITNVKYFTKN